MASTTTAQLSADVDFAMEDFQVTLTTVLPTASVGVEFTATRRELQDAFSVEESGRETKLDTRFYLNINGVSTYPSKGWVLDDGTNEFKVVGDFLGAGDVILAIDCTARYAQR